MICYMANFIQYLLLSPFLSNEGLNWKPKKKSDLETKIYRIGFQIFSSLAKWLIYGIFKTYFKLEGHFEILKTQDK